MQSGGAQGEAAASRLPGYPISDRNRISRRQALGRMSAVAGAGAAAWVVPEIFMAKPAAGTALSGPTTSGGSSGSGGGGNGGGGSGGGGNGGGGSGGGGNGGGGSGGGGNGNGGSGGSGPVSNPTTFNGTGGTGTPPNVVSTVDTTKPPVSSLAFTGLNLQRDVEIGAALIAGGWAMQYWASRIEKERPTP
jgi:hypothetical protein